MLKNMVEFFFKVSYLMRLPIVVQLLHSLQALPDSSDKVGPVSLTFQTKRCPNRLSFREKKKAGKLNCVTGICL